MCCGLQAVNCSRSASTVFTEDSPAEPLADKFAYCRIKRTAEAMVQDFVKVCGCPGGPIPTEPRSAQPQLVAPAMEAVVPFSAALPGAYGRRVSRIRPHRSRFIPCDGAARARRDDPLPSGGVRPERHVARDGGKPQDDDHGLASADPVHGRHVRVPRGGRGCCGGRGDHQGEGWT